MIEERFTNADKIEKVTVSPRRAALRSHWGQIVFGLGLSLYAMMGVLAHRYAYFGWDLALARRIQSVTLPGFYTLMVWVSALGSGWLPVALVVGAGLLLIGARFGLEGVICMAGVGSGSLVNSLLKRLSERPRPDQLLVHVMRNYTTDSFPSGHVTFFVTFFGFLFFLAYVLLRRGPLRRAALAALALPIVVVGVSRVYLGAHWPSDVIGAYLAGGLWLLLMIETYRRLKSKQQSRNDPYDADEV